MPAPTNSACAHARRFRNRLLNVQRIVTYVLRCSFAHTLTRASARAKTHIHARTHARARISAYPTHYRIQRSVHFEQLMRRQKPQNCLWARGGGRTREMWKDEVSRGEKHEEESAQKEQSAGAGMARCSGENAGPKISMQVVNVGPKKDAETKGSTHTHTHTYTHTLALTPRHTYARALSPVSHCFRSPSVSHACWWV